MANIIAIGGGGAKYQSGTLTTIDSSNKINVNMTKSTAANIEQESINHPNVLYFTEGYVNDGTVIKTTTATLLANNWTNTSQTVTVSGITSTCHILVSSAPANYQAYTVSGVYASASASNSITFSCIEVPEVNLVVNIAYWEDVT